MIVSFREFHHKLGIGGSIDVVVLFTEAVASKEVAFLRVSKLDQPVCLSFQCLGLCMELSQNIGVVSDEAAENTRTVRYSCLLQIVKTEFLEVVMRAKSDVVRVNLDIFRLEPEIDQLLLSFTSEIERVGNSKEKFLVLEIR